MLQFTAMKFTWQGCNAIHIGGVQFTEGSTGTSGWAPPGLLRAPPGLLRAPPGTSGRALPGLWRAPSGSLERARYTRVVEGSIRDYREGSIRV